MSQLASAQVTHGAEEIPQSAISTAERQPWELYGLVGGIIAQCAVVLLGNPPYVSAWLLTILAVSVGQALLLPSTAGWLGSLLGLVAWVLFRQVTGIWTLEVLAQGLAELAGLAVTVSLAVRYRQVWRRQQRELQELRALRQLLIASDLGTGLLPREVAELRLREEIERARQFRRPLGLLLVEIDLLPQSSTDALEIRDIYQATARQVVSASLVHDIPFRAGHNCIGMILPERDRSGLYKEAETIVSAAQGASFPDSEGRPRPVSLFARLNFGLGTYQGEQGSIDLMRAAVDSLNVGRELAELGEAPLSAYVMPATSIELSGPAVSNEEE